MFASPSRRLRDQRKAAGRSSISTAFSESPTRRVLVVGIAAIAAVAFVLRYQIANGFTILLSDRYDGLIESALYEHWHRVLTGHEQWNRPDYFHPYRDTLGYNDGFFLNGLIYTGLRVLGLDPLVTRELAGGAIRGLGFVSFHLLARVALGISFWPALLGAALFTVSNSLWIHGIHAQLITLDFAPLLMLLGWQSFQGFVRRRPVAAAGWGMAAAALYGAWLMTGFYMVWFGTLFSGLCVAALALLTPSRPRVVTGILRGLWDMKGTASVLAAWTLLCLVPFLVVYLPKVEETGQHPWDEVRGYLPPMLALFHVSHGNLLYGALDRRLIASLPDIGENTVGFTPGVLLASLAGMFLRGRPGQGRLPGALGLSCVLMVASVVQIGGHSAWYWVFQHVPGARGMRAVARIMLFLTFPTALLCAVTLDRLWLRHRLLSMLLGVFLLAEQVNSAPQLGLDRVQVAQMVARLGAPPTVCQSFFSIEGPPPASVQGNDVQLYGLYDANTPAMYLAELLGIPTLSGFSTFSPPDWDMNVPWDRSFLGRVAFYAHRHGVTDGLCSLDHDHLVWNTHPFASSTPPAGDVVINPDAPASYVHVGPGWSSPEKDGIWTDGTRAEIATFLRPGQRYRVVDVTANPFAPSGRISPVRLYANDRLLAEWKPAEDRQTMSIPLPSELQRVGYVRFRLDILDPRSPKAENISPDARQLGMFVTSLVVRAAAQ